MKQKTINAILAATLFLIALVSCVKEHNPSNQTDSNDNISIRNPNAILINPDPPMCVNLWPTWTYETYQGVWCYNYTWPEIHNDTIQVQWRIHPGMFWHKGNINRLYPAYATSYDIRLDGDTLESGTLPNIGTDFSINRTVTFPQLNYQLVAGTHPDLDSTRNWHQLWLSVYFNGTTMADGNIYAGSGFLCWRP